MKFPTCPRKEDIVERATGIIIFGKGPGKRWRVISGDATTIL